MTVSAQLFQQASGDSTFNIRPMQREDIEQVQAIDRTSFSMPWPTSAYNYELKNPMSMLWVAEVSLPENRPQVVGMIVVWLIIDEAHIATLAVDPGFRRQGIARRLLAICLKESSRQGMRSATLEVRANNPAAQKLYRRFHFEIVGMRPRYYRDNNEDALIMTLKDLGDAYLSWLESGAWNVPTDASGQGLSNPDARSV
jgi:ribosomal-protein-alanine N-acetyltransferase